LRIRRILPGENPNQVAAEQIRSWLEQAGPPAGAATGSIYTFDAGYDTVQLSLAVKDLPICLLVRLRAGRCFSADPTTQPHTGRPRRHGVKFAGDDPTTWPAPPMTWSMLDPHYGHVSLQAWSGLHATPHHHATRGSRRPRPLIRGTLIRLEVERLPRPTKAPTPLWFWWYGPTPPD
jgi:DDE superfamily endonuclease